MKKRKAGAPKGGYVHWLLWNLPSEFKGAYIYRFDVERRVGENYVRHNYTFYRKNGRTLYDVFVVVQTSKHYWRVMYTNIETKKYECFGYRNTRIIAEYMFELYKNSTEGKNDG